MTRRAAGGGAPAARKAKRRRLVPLVRSGSGTAAAGESNVDAVRLREEWCQPAARQQLRNDFAAGRPYPHGVIKSFLGGEGFHAVRADLERIDAREKETDLFRFFQTADLKAALSGGGAARRRGVGSRRTGRRGASTGRGRGAAGRGSAVGEVADNTAPTDSSASLEARCPALTRLVALFGSAEFRDLCQEVTQCGELTNRVDLSAQVYTRGGHLLCHDDVIGTRKVSFIYYLTDPVGDWQASEGGALELYPQKPGALPGTPDTSPSKELLPTADSLAFFVVEPGVSFHAVREVLSDRARVSIQGWLHAPSLELTKSFEHRGLATLQQLLDRNTSRDGARGESETADARGAEADHDAEGEGDLCEGDIDLLGRWISPVYLRAEQLEVIAERFADASYAVLTSFLLPAVASRLASEHKACDTADGFCAAASCSAGPAPEGHEPGMLPYGVGLVDGWEAIGPPHLRRYLRFAGRNFEGTKTSTSWAQAGGSADASQAEVPARATGTSGAQGQLGNSLSEVASELFGSPAFKRWLRRCTRLGPHDGGRIEVRRFRPGMDYTVAARSEEVPAGCASLDVTLGFVEAESTATQELWASEDAGGFESYIAADEEDETAHTQERYRVAENDGPLVNLPASSNTLCIVMRDAETLRFVKYLSKGAPSSRVDVTACFDVDAPDGSTESGEGEAN